MGQARRLPWDDASRDEAPVSQGGARRDDPADRFAGLDKVIRFALAPKEQRPDTAQERRRNDEFTHRDWSAALDLVRQASDAIRVTEARNQEMEARIQGLMRRASQELEAAEARIEAAEARAGEAEARAEAAEEWLRRLHEAITEGFHPRQVEARPRTAPQPAK
jgi:hypothetical protein